MLVGVLDHIECALEVYVDYRVKIGFLHIEHQLVACDTGIINKYIDSAEVSDHLIYYLFGFFKVGNVAEILLNLCAVL